MKKDALYNYGMKPAVLSVNAQKEGATLTLTQAWAQQATGGKRGRTCAILKRAHQLECGVFGR